MTTRPSSVIKQILNFGIVTAIISLLLACVGFGVVEYYSIRNAALTKLNTQINMLAYNLQSPIVFEDKESAEKILQALKGDRSVTSIQVFKSNGDVFVASNRSNSSPNMRLNAPIVFENKVIGTIVIEAVYLGVKERYRTYFLISLFIIAISIPLSYVISHPIRKQVSKAVVQLEEQSQRLRMLTDQVVTTEQRERKRIAALIHDHLQQLLVAGKLQIGLTFRALEKNELGKAIANLKRVDEFIDESTRAARTLTVELRPPVLYEDGLVPALEWLANKYQNEHDFAVRLHADDFPSRLPDSLKIMIFESVKEILFNAVKYSGVRSIDVFLSCPGSCISIIIKDKGHGFDVARLEIKSSEKGFGLFSIRERLKLLNGSLRVSSQPGQGTEVEIIVPLPNDIGQTEAASRSGSSEVLDSNSEGKAIRVLLVDDHKIVREGIANILKENRLINVVAQAEDGNDAVEKAGIYRPDIIIMDVNMPHLNGIEATRVIKQRFPEINIIGLSVQDEVGVADSMKKAGAITLINKAGDPQHLIEAIMAV